MLTLRERVRHFCAGVASVFESNAGRMGFLTLQGFHSPCLPPSEVAAYAAV